MIKLIKQAQVYAPEYLGRMDILVCGEKIADIRPSIQGFEGLAQAEIIEADGARLAPAYIDIHEHITGGGGEQGFASRVPEIRLSDITLAGVATVVGLLGTDSETRSLENLYAKTCSLELEGITAFMLTGAYSYPPKTLTGGVARDITLIDKVIGVKSSLSDHRSSNMTAQELTRLASDARLGGLISGKQGLTVLHVGCGEAKLNLLFEVLSHSDIPISRLLPTHVSRSPELLKEAVRFAKLGGTIDFTAGDDGGTAKSIQYALEQGADLSRITMSSDACGSIPKFDKDGCCTGLTYTLPSVLHTELLRLVQEYRLPLEKALKPLTQNPAELLGISDRKGRIAKGQDADFIIYDDELRIRQVFARGAWMVRDGKAVKKGRFE